jgi:soluble P-type ATPase
MKYTLEGNPVVMGWNETNEEIAKREADNGEYTIEDDGVAETTEPTSEERIAELEEALELLLSGVTE